MNFNTCKFLGNLGDTHWRLYDFQGNSMIPSDMNLVRQGKVEGRDLIFGDQKVYAFQPEVPHASLEQNKLYVVESQDGYMLVRFGGLLEKAKLYTFKFLNEDKSQWPARIYRSGEFKAYRVDFTVKLCRPAKSCWCATDSDYCGEYCNNPKPIEEGRP